MADDRLTACPTPTSAHQTTAHRLYVKLRALLDNLLGHGGIIAVLLLIRRPRRINTHIQQPTALQGRALVQKTTHPVADSMHSGDILLLVCSCIA